MTTNSEALKPHKCIIFFNIVLEITSLKWISPDKNQSTDRSGFLLEAEGYNQFSCLLQLLEPAFSPCFMALSFILETSSVVASNLSDSDRSDSIFLLIGTIVIITGPPKLPRTSSHLKIPIRSHLQISFVV